VRLKPCVLRVAEVTNKTVGAQVPKGRDAPHLTLDCLCLHKEEKSFSRLCLPACLFLFVLFPVLGMEPRALCMPDRCCVSDLHPQLERSLLKPLFVPEGAGQRYSAFLECVRP
jgi:hypothetical protein